MRALEDAGVSAEQIGTIRVGVNTWMRFPNLTTQLQDAIGASNASAADISAGCSGFIYAIKNAYKKLIIKKSVYSHDIITLMVKVDGLSHVTDWTDRQTCVLLGDGAGAVVMKQVDSGGILATHTHTNKNYDNYL